MQYYVACKRELWLFAHNINLDDYDENMVIGRFIHEKSFPREKKSVLIDNTIAPDFVKKGKGDMKIFEIKKSDKLEEAAKMQTYYYLWYLKNKKGIETKAILTYPTKKKKKELKLTQKIEEEIEKTLKEIPKIINKKKPPERNKKAYCKKCAYYELCWI